MIDCDYTRMPFVVGIFCGTGKPSNVFDYLRQFVNELSDLLSSGITFGGRVLRVAISSFICDAPARAFVKQIKSHNGYSGCDKCSSNILLFSPLKFNTCQMAQVWKVVEFQDRSAAVVPLIWLASIDGELCCYWPPLEEKKIEKAAMSYIPPAQGWHVHRGVRVLKTCGTYLKAQCSLQQSLEEGCRTADLQSEDEYGPRKRRPNKRYNEGDEKAPSRKRRQPPLIEPFLDSEWQFPSLNEGDYLPNVCCNLKDMGISTVISLLNHLREDNRQLKEEVGRLAQEVRAMRREMGRQETPQTSPLFPLPLSTMEEFKAAEALLKANGTQMKVMVSTLALCGGTEAGAIVRRMLRTLLSNGLASQFNWAGKGEKTAFKHTNVHDVLFDALQKQLPGSTHAVFGDNVKKWLKYAPERGGRVKSMGVGIFTI
ncbi:hypothetical protein ACEWY4_001563 [Coilia grayii]|uniref:DUF4806 domain-containing protein n=1 Tax=Coilia grayii TaxID=363190 RepID=A0ABD1KTB7_9TELE